MIKEIIMPKLGQTIKEAIIEKWLKKEGDKVARGEVLLEITTDKAALEIESQHDGLVRKILAKEGEKVEVLTVIGFIADSMDEKIPEVKVPAQELKREQEKVKKCSMPKGLKFLRWKKD